MSSNRGKHVETPLSSMLRAQIQHHGPMRIDEYMHACLSHPEHGYWHKATTTIGADGDFITAPEISQVFGEIIGLWAIDTWRRMSKPSPLRLAELGPGRGTLMRDALRAARLVPAFLQAASVHLVESSPALRENQQRLLSTSIASSVAWHDSIVEVPAGAAIIIANEFLDALPIRQFVFLEGQWRERTVVVDAAGNLGFGAGDVIPFHGGFAPSPGNIAEQRAGEDAIIGELARRGSATVALFIDYGPDRPCYGDTLQAVKRHAYADPLAEPGHADLTSHVQFGEFASKARTAGFAVDGPITQAEFLGRLGVVERAARLMALNPEAAGHIEAGVQRLTDPTGMGRLFKCVVVRSPQLQPPEPFAQGLAC